MSQTKRSRIAAVLAAAVTVVLAAALVGAGPAEAGKVHKHKVKRHTVWAATSAATITPGVMMYTDGAQCTANFVFNDGVGNVYVGYAAHCAGLGGQTDTDGCTTKSLPLGTPVDFTQGGNLLTGEGTVLGHGTLAYSSWNTMAAIGTTDANACAYNDLALVKVNAADVAKVNPTVPFWGGPTGIDTDGTAAGDRVYTYGNSSLRAGISLLSPHTGISLGDSAADGGWSHPLYTVSPGIPGDSGSGFMTAGGKAIGVLSTLGLTPLPLSNNIGDLAKELAFAQAHSGLTGLKLVNGTAPFSSPL